jgi:hypothetical protein
MPDRSNVVLQVGGWGIRLKTYLCKKLIFHKLNNGSRIDNMGKTPRRIYKDYDLYVEM